ncbi:DUF1566 domain-containing protein [Candidatus Woesearchaeota archaeon]|nr:DUF1566 domain-containing protein [Candidatus Woesearchaeota archaeon]
MKKIFVLIIVLMIVLVLASFALTAKDKANKNPNNPFAQLWAAISDLQDQIDEITGGGGECECDISREEFDALEARVEALEGSVTCINGDTRACYTGDPATRSIGECGDGTETCVGGEWEGVCVGEQLPVAEDCDDDLDNDCDGDTDDDDSDCTECVADADCNDNDGCTTNTCDAGECVYTPETCDDTHDCTIDTCSSAGDFSFDCEHHLDVDSCLISDACYDDHEVNQANECEECDPATSQGSWTPLAPGTPCTGGECNGVGVCVSSGGGDDCTDPFVITTVDNEYTSPATDTTTFGADYDASCASTASAPDTVYMFTVPETGLWSIAIESADFDTVLFMSDTCDGSSNLGCADAIGDGGEELVLELTQGETVYIYVDGWSSAIGIYTLSVRLLENSDNDNVPDVYDNCWYVDNPAQVDSDGDCPSVPYLTDPLCGDACESLRFLDHGDGTVEDLTTGLFWLKDATCLGLINSTLFFDDMDSITASLADGQCDLTDGSTAGNWRVPTEAEWTDFLDTTYASPPLCNAYCSAQWTEGDAFTNIEINDWSYGASSGMVVSMSDGTIFELVCGAGPTLQIPCMYVYIWPVRDSIV